MQRLYNNRDKIMNVIISCKTEEQLGSVKIWIDNIVNIENTNDLNTCIFLHNKANMNISYLIGVEDTLEKIRNIAGIK